MAFYCILFLITLSDTSPFQHLNMQDKSILPCVKTQGIKINLFYPVYQTKFDTLFISIYTCFSKQPQANILY